MFAPACVPDWSATEPSCGSALSVCESTIHAVVADDHHLWMLRDGEVGRDVDAVSLLELEAERRDDRVRLEAGAPHEGVRLDGRSGLELDPRRRDRRHDLSEPHLDATLLERLLRVGADVALEHREQRGSCLDQRDRGLLLRDLRVVLRELVAVQLDQRPGALDAGRTAPDDGDVQRSVLDQGGIPVGRLPATQHVRAEAHGVRERVQRECVLVSALDAEVVDLGAERDDEVVVGQRGHLAELHGARRKVDRGHRRLVDASTFGCLWKRPRNGCPTAVVSSRSVATWYSSGWNVW